MEHPTIVAFMQEPWFPEGTNERHIISYRDNQDFHHRLLFNTMSGRRLLSAFGDLAHVIHWDNANWRPTWMTRGKTAPDYDHMAKVIEKHKPEIVITFGSVAADAMFVVLRLLKSCHPMVLDCHHPNARHKTQADLDEFAVHVRSKIVQLQVIGGELPPAAEDHGS